MSITAFDGELSHRVRDLVRTGFAPRFGALRATFGTNPVWQRLAALGSELWFDSGDIDDISKLWTREYAGLTTNNTLLNKEVQKGIYDDFLFDAAALLDKFPKLTPRERKLELAFMVNARHALRLVELFDAHVSVEEHTDLSNDVDGAVNYARRYYAVCPERFYVKIPFSAAGLLATRQASLEAIPVNHTLGFSARQNYVIARIGRPAFVNVFMGRLNSFVADNKLGDGAYVGERATLASQAAVRDLAAKHKATARQIGASFREPQQVRDLAGIDVMTIPCKVAQQFLDLKIPPESLADKTGEHYEPSLAAGADAGAIGLDTLWEVEDKLVACLDKLDAEGPSSFTADGLVKLFEGHGCGDVLVRWTDKEIRTSAKEGKIPRIEHWQKLLAERKIGLDSLMNLAGWNSFAADQKEMDDHIKAVLEGAKRR